MDHERACYGFEKFEIKKVNIMPRFESIAARVCPSDLEPHIILLVHEAPSNPCSERWALLDWFSENGIAAQEYPIPKKEKVFLF